MPQQAFTKDSRDARFNESYKGAVAVAVKEERSAPIGILRGAGICVEAILQ